MLPKKYLFTTILTILFQCTATIAIKAIENKHNITSIHKNFCDKILYNTKNKFPYPSLPLKTKKKTLKLTDNLTDFLPKNVIEATVKNQSSNNIDTIIFYQAQDSIMFNIQKQKIELHGKGAIEYGDINLDAEKITLNWTKNNITASGKQDSLGKLYGRPLFEKKEEQYLSDSIRYNFSSKKVIIHKIVTKKNDGFIHGDHCKKNEENAFLNQAKYTTCDLKNPHFHIGAQKIKMIKDEQVVSGPLSLYFYNIPLPIGFFLGIFYLPNKKFSGFILPKYGMEKERGMYLKNGGYYFYFNDYIDLTIKGSFYAKGSIDLLASTNYAKRYRYSGKVAYQQTRNTGGKEDIFTYKKNSQFTWTHQTKYTKNNSLFADVHISSYTEQQYNRRTYHAYIPNAKLQSSIRYNNNFRGFLYHLNANLVFRQNLKTKQTSIIFPNISLCTKNMRPFQKFSNRLHGAWYKNLIISHQINLKNEVNNVHNQDTIKINLKNLPILLRKGKYGIQHTIPLKTNFKIFQYFNLSPTIQYKERWYFQQLNYQYDDKKDKVLADTVHKFSRVWEYSFGADLNTTLYGIHYFNQKNSKIKAFRHQIFPSISFTYIPNFSQKKYGYFQKVQINKKKERKKLSRYHNFVYGSPINRARARLDLAIGNNIEMKIKTKNTKNDTKKISFPEKLNIYTSYDFLADSFKLDNIQLNISNSFFDKLIQIQYNATFFPYLYRLISRHIAKNGDTVIHQQKVEAFAWHHGKGLGQCQSSTISINTKLNKKILEKIWYGVEEEEDSEIKQRKAQNAAKYRYDPTHYVDFQLPWNLQLAYIVTNQKKGFKPKKNKKILTFNGNLQLSTNWDISFSSGYNFSKKKLLPKSTKIQITRNLHCWEIRLSWHPLGKHQWYDLSIGIKANSLKDIRYTTEKKYQDFD